MKQCGLWPVEDNDRSRGAWVGADAAPGWGDLVTLVSTYTPASNEGYPKVPKDFIITEKAPTRAPVRAFSVIMNFSRTFV